MEFTALTPILAWLTKLDEQTIRIANGCHIQFENKLSVQIEWDEKEKKLNLYSVLMLVPTKNATQFYAMLLDAHLFGQLTQNTFFGLHDTRDEVVLFQKIALETIDEQAFFVLFDRFVAQVNEWYHILARYPLHDNNLALQSTNFA